MNCPFKTLGCLFLSGSLIYFRTFLPAHAQIAGGNAGCPAGTRENPVNLVRNSSFSQNAGSGLGNPTGPAVVPAATDFTSDLPYRGDAVYPSDPIGGLSIQDERFNGGQIPGAPPGVVNGRGVTAAEAQQLGLDAVPIPTYLYSNPSLNTANQPVTIPEAPPGTPPPIVWRQDTITVGERTVYNFKGLFFNLLLPNTGGFDPRIRLQVGAAGTPITAPLATRTPFSINVGDGSPVPGFPNIRNVRQAWIPVQFSFTTEPGQTAIQLRIIDEAQNTFGDDFGLTAVGLRECVPNIGLAKEAGEPILNSDGSFTVPYRVRVRNLAPDVGPPEPYTLNNLQLTENLANTFAGATIVSVSNLQSSTLRINPAFNGTSDINLLQSNVNSLAAGSQGLVSFNVTIRLPEGQENNSFENSIVATGNTNSGIQVLDRSNNGSEVDPDNDGDPTNNNSPTIVRLPASSAPPPTGNTSTSNAGVGNILLVKRISNVVRNGVALPGVNFGGFVDDPNTTDDNNPGWTALPPAGIFSLSTDNLLQSGDELEYTIYILSNGTSAAIDFSICDQIPVGTSLIPNTNQIRLGNNPVTSGGTVFTPLAPLPTNNPCSDQRNPNGAIIFNLGTLPNTSPNNIGFARFRVRVN